MQAEERSHVTVVEQPRERLMLYGAASLSDSELVALVLRGNAASDRARELLDGVGGVLGLAHSDAHELAGHGASRVGASSLAAAVELARRVARAEFPWSLPLRRPGDVAEYVRAALRGSTQEHFLVLGLDARQRVRMQRTVAIGSLAHVDVHPRELFRPLVRAGMHSAILVHNHPSGDPEPSEADIDLTHRMTEVGRLLGIPVLDHLVVTDTESTSLAALGVLG